MGSRLKNREGETAGDKQKKMNRKQRQQRIAACVIAILLVGAMVATLIPTFFM